MHSLIHCGPIWRVINQAGVKNWLTDCHQCEAGLLLAQVYIFSHEQKDSEMLKAENWHIITAEQGWMIHPLISKSHLSFWCTHVWMLHQQCLICQARIVYTLNAKKWVDNLCFQWKDYNITIPSTTNFFVLFYFLPLIRVTGATVWAGRSRHSSPQGTTKMFLNQLRDTLSPACLFLDGHAQNTSLERRAAGILTTCPNHLNWVLSRAAALLWASLRCPCSFSYL